jgi:uncharacterized protein with NRDE domain
MCLLILLAGVDPDWPVIVAGNRDEQRDRPSAPPGLFVGERMRVLSPRDRLAGGTWLAVGERGLFAGVTNLAGVPRRAGARSRGTLPHLAADCDSVASAVRAVREAVQGAVFDGFQLVVSDGKQTHVFAHANGELDEHEVVGGVLVISNEHRLGELELPGLERACAQQLALDDRLAILREQLLDTGSRSGHRILKLGGDYGTVSSSLIAIPARDIRALRWGYAAGSPDVAPYREYGNLARRLIDG